MNLMWDSRGTKEDPASVGIICPECAALIPPGADRTGNSYQIRHQDWHRRTS